jgi:hypothetical protein
MQVDESFALSVLIFSDGRRRKLFHLSLSQNVFSSFKVPRASAHTDGLEESSRLSVRSRDAVENPSRM